MTINGIANVSGLSGPEKIKKSGLKKIESFSKEKDQADKVTISEKARLAHGEAVYINTLKTIPDVRPEAVKKAKDDMENGKLYTPEIIEKTAEAILERLF
ncbi:MAG: hypothetical protein JW774_12005 [Candidatus Aureabacteria bacterium]|nr:hypothetical protein [Candidatus Auribacterota bacterium]